MKSGCELKGDGGGGVTIDLIDNGDDLRNKNIEKNPIGPDLVHVLKLNIALDALK